MGKINNVNEILKQKEFRPYVRGLSVWVGFKQSFVKYIREPRGGGETKFPLFSAGPVTQFVNGVTGSAKTNYDLNVKITKEPSTALLGKIGNDTGSDSSNLKANTGVMDFTVTIPDEQNYGDIVSLSWVLSDVGTNETPKYMKENAAGTFFSFEYDLSLIHI